MEDADNIELEKDKKITTTEDNNENLKCDFDDCDFIAMSVYILKIHKNAHKTCPYCNQKIFSEQNLISHVQKYHKTKQKKTRKCDICEQTFKDRSKLGQHYKLCRKKAHVMNEIKQFHQNFKKSLERSSNEKSTLLADVSNVFENSLNPLDFLHVEEVTELNIKSEPEELLSTDVQDQVNMENTLGHSLGHESKSEMIKNTAVLTKFHNFDSFSDTIQRNKIQSDLVLHHLNSTRSNESNNVLASNILMEESKSKSVILEPKLQSKSKSVILEPKQSKIKGILIPAGSAYCDFCEMEYEVNANSTITKHLKSIEHKNSVERKNGTSNSGTTRTKSVWTYQKTIFGPSIQNLPAKKYSCVTCKAFFLSKSDFLRHQEQCIKQTADINNLKSSGSRKSCPKCFKEFPHILFKAHVKSQHYLCDTCMKWFSTLKSRKEHTAVCKKEEVKLDEPRIKVEQAEELLSDPLADAEPMEISVPNPENISNAYLQSPTMLEVKDELVLETSEIVYVKTEPLF